MYLPAEMKAKYPSVWDYYNSPDYKQTAAIGGTLMRGVKKLDKKKRGGILC